MRRIILSVLILWFAAIFLLGAAGAFVRPHRTPPIPILIGLTIPLVVFFAWYRGSAAFRTFILALDLLPATAIRPWASLKSASWFT